MIETTLPAHSGLLPACPKCGAAVENARYCAPNGSSSAADPTCRHGGAGEHLHRRCHCGYQWAERCADAETGGPNLGAIRESTAREKADPASLPIDARPAGAPGGIAGGASDHDRRDPVVQGSDDSFPASDPPAY